MPHVSLSLTLILSLSLGLARVQGHHVSRNEFRSALCSAEYRQLASC